MTNLTESVNGLKEAIQRQETQISSYDINLSQNTELIPNREFSEESKLSNGFLKTQSGVSHWSWNVDSIHDMVDDMKTSLSGNEKQIFQLMTDNDRLKEEIKKKEKELKVQTELLSNERETFEKCKRETCINVKRRKSKESQVQEKLNEKAFDELSKLNTELALFKQMYLDQTHSLNSLSRRVSNVKDDNKSLRNKLLRQETRSHKYILEAAKRFDAKRKEFKELAKDKYAHETDHYKLILYGTIEKNSSLAFDNSVLKFELDTLHQQLSEIKSEESLTGSGHCGGSRPATRDGFRRILRSRFESDEHAKFGNTKKSSPSHAKSKTSSLKVKDIIFSVRENPEKKAAWQRGSSKKLDNVDPRENTTEESETYLARTNSAPELGYGVL